MADRLVNSIPDARLVRLAEWRAGPEENPEHLSELLLDFIKEERRHEPSSIKWCLRLVD